jgi:hypothetical protein
LKLNREIVVSRNAGYASNKELKSHVVHGREIHSRLAGSIRERKDEWDLLWLWQCWQEEVIVHLKTEDRKTFVSRKFTLAGQIGSLAYLAGCFARELEFLENLLKSSEAGLPDAAHKIDPSQP